ncbi:unnamed protein product, partial [marine sediment metagenome]
MIKMKIEKFKIESYDEVVGLWRKAGIEIVSSDTIDEVTRVLNRNPDLFLIGRVQEKIIAVVMGAFDGRRGVCSSPCSRSRLPEDWFWKIYYGSVNRAISNKEYPEG